MKMEYLKNLEENLNLFSVKPSTAKEIKNLEEKLNIKLPKVIVEFFELSGGNYDDIWGGGGEDTIYKIDYTIDLAKRLLKETSIELGNYFPFSSYNDDQFLFIIIDEQENNPKVYRFEMELFHCGEDYIPNSNEWNLPKGVIKIADSFSEMIDKIIELKKLKE